MAQHWWIFTLTCSYLTVLDMNHRPSRLISRAEWLRCSSKWEAISLKKELDGKDLGADAPLSVPGLVRFEALPCHEAKTITSKEKDELVAKQNEKGDVALEPSKEKSSCSAAPERACEPEPRKCEAEEVSEAEQ